MNLVHRAASCVVGLLCLALASCGSGGGGSGGGSGSGGGGGLGGGSTLRIHVTDAPFPIGYVTSASVVIREVRVHERTSDAWSTVFTGAASIDLVPLQNGVTDLLVEAAVPPGTYDSVRLIVDAGEVVLSDAAVVNGSSRAFTTADGTLFFPSGAQTGIKIGIENDIVVTTQLSGDLLLDFDLSRNFVFNGPVTHAPGVRRVIFTPSVRATNASVAGSVAMTVLSDELTPLDPTDDAPLSGATVRVFDATADPMVDPPVATAFTDVGGRVSISLAPGAYVATVEATGHETLTLPSFTVVLANLTDLGMVVLAATGTISGVVMSDGATAGDTSDDVVVAGATIDVFPTGTSVAAGSAISGASGEFQIAGLAAGAYDVAIHASGFTDLMVTGVAATLGGTGQTYLLAALTANLSGTVTDSTAAAIAGVTVTVVNAAGVQVASTTTAADGTYAAVLPTGTYQVTFVNGAVSQTQSLTVVGASPPGSVVLDATL